MSQDPYRYFRIEARELSDELAAGVSDLARGAPTATAVAALLRHAHTLKGAARVVNQPEVADRTHALEELLGPYRGSALPVPDEAQAAMLRLIDEISAEVTALEQSTGPSSDRPTDASSSLWLATGGNVGPGHSSSPAPSTLPPIPAAHGSRPALTLTGTGNLFPQWASGAADPQPGSVPVSRPPVGRSSMDQVPGGQASREQTSREQASGAPASGGPASGEQQPAPQPRDRTARASLAEIDAVIAGVRAARIQFAALHRSITQLATFHELLAAPVGEDVGDRQRKVSALQSTAEQVQRTLTQAVDRMDRDLRGVRDVAERLRLVSVDSIVPDLERAARDVAAEQDKRVILDVAGGQLRLDSPVLAATQAALRQIVRNAVAHGIDGPEQRIAQGKDPIGRITLRVTQNGGRVTFTCTDDGNGVDLDAVRSRMQAGGQADARHLTDAQVLDRLLLGGVSTAKAVSEVSGRGIGLDVVHDAAVQLGGRAEIRTDPGRGTTIELVVPVSLAAQDVILVDGRIDRPAAGWASSRTDDRPDGSQVLAIPLRAVSETVRLRADQIRRAPRGESIFHRGRIVPFAPLAAAMGAPDSSSRSQPIWSVLVMESAAGPAAIGVTQLLGTAEIAIRPVPALAPVPPVVGGVWVDVDGHPQLMLNPDAVAAAITTHRQLAQVARAAVVAPILVIDDSLTTRMLEQSILESAGYQVQTAASAEEGLDLAMRRPFALVLVDVEMPGMDGFGFVAQTRLRPELQHLPCILVTSRASDADRRHGVEVGARAHIDKREFHQGTLLGLISNLISGGPVFGAGQSADAGRISAPGEAT